LIAGTKEDALREKVWGTSDRLLGLWWGAVVVGSGVKKRALSVFGGGDFSPTFIGLLTEAVPVFMVDWRPQQDNIKPPAKRSLQ